MPPFQAKYTDEQRTAIAALKRQGLSGRDIALACSRGTHDLEPFTVNPDSANRIARAVNARRAELEKSPVATRAESDPRAATRELVGRLTALADRHLTALETRHPNRPPRAQELKAAADVLEHLERTTRRLEPKPGAGIVAGNGSREADPTDLIDRLAAGIETAEPPREGATTGAIATDSRSSSDPAADAEDAPAGDEATESTE